MKSPSVCRSVWISASCLFLSMASFAAFSSSDKGTATAQFLQLGVNARAIGMGEAFSALADDASALYWNPAGLTRMPDHGGSVSLMHAPYVESSYFDYAALGHRIGAGAFGLGAQYFNAGSLSRTDRGGNDLGTFTPYDVAASLGYAYGGSAGSLGIAGKYIQSKILASAQTFAVDFGYLTPALLQDRLRLAFVAQNIGGKMKFDSESEDLPTTLRAGSAYALTSEWTVAADLVFPRNNAPDFGAGTEYRWRLGSDSALAARLGFNTRTVGDLSGLNGLSMGLGLGFGRLSIDYAFLPMGQLGLTHRISLSLRWGDQNNQKVAALGPRRDRRAALNKKPRCEDLYGDINCEESSRPPSDRLGPSGSGAAPRPW